MTLYEYSDDPGRSLTKGLDYMLYFRQNCTQDLDRLQVYDFKCAYEQMKALGIDHNKVDKCFQNSFEK